MDITKPGKRILPKRKMYEKMYVLPEERYHEMTTTKTTTTPAKAGAGCKHASNCSSSSSHSKASSTDGSENQVSNIKLGDVVIQKTSTSVKEKKEKKSRKRKLPQHYNVIPPKIIYRSAPTEENVLPGQNALPPQPTTPPTTTRPSPLMPMPPPPPAPPFFPHSSSYPYYSYNMPSPSTYIPYMQQQPMPPPPPPPPPPPARLPPPAPAPAILRQAPRAQLRPRQQTQLVDQQQQTEPMEQENVDSRAEDRESLEEKFRMYEQLMKENFEKQMQERNDELIEQMKYRDHEWLLKMNEAFMDYKNSLNRAEQKNEQYQAKLEQMRQALLEQLHRVEPQITEGAPPAAAAATDEIATQVTPVKSDSVGTSTTQSIESRLRSIMNDAFSDGRIFGARRRQPTASQRLPPIDENIDDEKPKIEPPNSIKNSPPLMASTPIKTENATLPATSSTPPIKTENVGESAIRTPKRPKLADASVEVYQSPVMKSSNRRHRAAYPTKGARFRRLTSQEQRSALGYEMSPIIRTRGTVTFGTEAKRVRNRQDLSQIMRARVRELQAAVPPPTPPPPQPQPATTASSSAASTPIRSRSNLIRTRKEKVKKTRDKREADIRNARQERDRRRSGNREIAAAAAAAADAADADSDATLMADEDVVRNLVNEALFASRQASRQTGKRKKKTENLDTTSSSTISVRRPMKKKFRWDRTKAGFKRKADYKTASDDEAMTEIPRKGRAIAVSRKKQKRTRRHTE